MDPTGLHDPGGVPPAGRAGRPVSASAALDAIEDGSRVFVSGGAAAPIVLDRLMAEQADRWTGIELVCDRLLEPLAVFDHPGRPFRLVSLQPSPAVDGMRSAGAYRSAAGPFSGFGGLISPAGPYPVDVAVVHVSPPGPDGRHSLGVSVATPLAAMAAASLVIAQVNPRMPYTFGSGELAADRFDLLVDAEHELLETPGPTQRDAAMTTIGGEVAGLIPDGATLQIGIGAVADAVLDGLRNHTDLSVHSGMISDGIVALAGSGALTGSSHPLFPGKIVAGLIGGTRTVFDFVDRNPAVRIVAATISHGAAVLAALPRFTAINSAVEVDLTGAANGEFIGSRVISGPGGAPDYAAAAAAHQDGRYIVALPATAGGRRLSRIVRRLDPARPPTVPGTHVGAVVTEHGTALLDGRSAAARATALIDIAEPDVRRTLSAT
ncbi:MAG: acetyl-CoA hydrolase/transferase C-terminal domain-containing protein [Actinomycetota bacterium]